MTQLRGPRVHGVGAWTQYIEVDYSRHVRVPPPAMLARRQDEDINSFTSCGTTWCDVNPPGSTVYALGSPCRAEG